MRKGLCKAVSITDANKGACVLALMLVVIIAGVAYSVHLGSELRYPDERDYYQIASHLVTSGRFSINGADASAFRPPGYPLFLSVFIFLGAGVVQLRIVNFLLLAGCMYLAGKVIREHATARAAVLGALGVMCYPALFYAAGTLFPQTLGAFLFLLTLHFLTMDRLLMRYFIISGAAFGYLVLTIPLFALIVLPLALGIYLGRSPEFRRRCLYGILVFMIPIAVWCVRNYIVFHSPIIVSANSGLNLLLGNSENATPDSGADTDISRYRREAIEMRLTFVERDAYYHARAVEWIREHKREAAKLYVLKFLNYFNYRNNLWVTKEFSSFTDTVMLLTYGPLLLLTILRFLLAGRYKLTRFEILLAVLYISNALFYAIYFTRIRFRLPFDILLICIVAIFLDALWQRRTGVSGGPAASSEERTAASS